MAEDFQSRLFRELTAWQAEQLVSESQAAAIRARYRGTNADAPGGNRLANALAFLGAVLLGIGVIVFFAANWQAIPGWVKLGAIAVAVAVADWAGFRLRYQTEAYRGTGSALLFLGALLFGAAIFLVAQGLHVNADAPVLLLLWAVGVLPMAYLLTFPAMLVLAVLSLALALGWEANFWLQGASAFSAYFAAYLVFGVLLYGLGALHARSDAAWRAFGRTFGVIGLLLILGACFPFTFAWEDGWVTRTTGVPPEAALRFSFLLGAAAVPPAALLLVPGLRRPPESLLEAAALLALLLIGGSVFFFELGGTAAAIGFNLLLLVLIVGLIAAGYHRREPAWVNVGTLFFAALVVARYFDWFWNLMPRALFFAGAGVLLLLGGLFLERARRGVLRTAGESEAPA